MCKLIADLLEANKREVNELFLNLERHSALPGLDIRLTGEIYGRLHMKMRELGLDPRDTTPHELYQSLLSLTSLHDQFLAKRLGIKHDDSTEISAAVVRFINRLPLPKHSLSLKHVSAKKLLKATPPKHLMKLLNYRSLDSMLKREPLTQLLTVARHTEPKLWQQKFVQSYKKLESNDFEVRNIEIQNLSDKRWESVGEFLRDNRISNIIHTPEAGAIVYLPFRASKNSGLTLVSLLLGLHYINEIRTFSTYSKFHQMRPDFGALLVEHILNEKSDHALLAGQPIHWRVIHRYYGSVGRLSHPEIFEPHVQPEDLSYRRAEEILYRVEPALHFWHDLDFVGLSTADGPISFSLTDMAMNLVNNLPYEKRVYYHMQGALWNEIYGRYICQRNLENNILQQLDDQSIYSSLPNMDMEFAW